MTQVSVVDYGIGNLHSVTKALSHVGADVTVIDGPEGVAKADRLVVPGVGAFAQGMRELSARGLVSAIQAHARAGKPLLGICLGMQMLMDESEEFGKHAGLGLIAGTVCRLTESKAKVPHIGWSRIEPTIPDAWGDTILSAVVPGTFVYFVHSFHVKPSPSLPAIARTGSADDPITAAIRVDNVTGLQFHPEKSGPVGLHMLENFSRS